MTEQQMRSASLEVAKGRRIGQARGSRRGTVRQGGMTPTSDVGSTLETARRYVAKNWAVVPVPHGKKAPHLPGWPKLRLSDSELPNHFNGKPQNIGVLLGRASGGLVDVVLNSDAAVRLAPMLLPKTLTFGRQGNPCSHWLFRCNPAAGSKTFQIVGMPIVEVKSTGTYSLFPNSIHESGEQLRFDQDVEPARIDGADLMRRVRLLAVAALVATVWPPQELRLDASNALAGALYRSGYANEEIAEAVEAVAFATNDPEAKERPAVASTWITEVTNRVPDYDFWANLSKHIPQQMVNQAWSWLRLAEDSPVCSTPLMRFAQLIVAENWTIREGSTVRSWQDALWHWTGECYRRLDRNEVEALVYKWLDSHTESVSPNKASNVIKCISTQVSVPDRVEQPVWLGDSIRPCEGQVLAMRNGLLDVDGLLAGKSHVLHKHSSCWFSQNVFGYDFDGQATCPKWLKFLEQCLKKDAERIALLQEWFGYCLTHDTSFQKMMFFVGEGANGKSVASNTLRELVGSANCSHVALEQFGNRFQLGASLGKLVNICGDTGQLDKVAEGALKQFTGGDRMHFDRKYLSPIEATPTARLLVLMNNTPNFTDRSDGIWRRILMMPWAWQIPVQQQDKRLVASHLAGWPFRVELPGIFNWSIEGLRRLHEQGGFTEPSVCRDALAEYRQESNPARMYLDERYVINPKGCIGVDWLYSNYSAWCDSSGYRTLAKNNFGKEVKRFCPDVRKKRGGPDKARIFKYEGFEHRTSQQS